MLEPFQISLQQYTNALDTYLQIKVIAKMAVPIVIEDFDFHLGNSEEIAANYSRPTRIATDFSFSFIDSKPIPFRLEPNQTFNIVLKIQTHFLSSFSRCEHENKDIAIQTLVTMKWTSPNYDHSKYFQQKLVWKNPIERTNDFIVEINGQSPVFAQEWHKFQVVITNTTPDPRSLTLFFPSSLACSLKKIENGNATAPFIATESTQLFTALKPDVQSQAHRAVALEGSCDLGHLGGFASASVEIQVLPMRSGEIKLSNMVLYDQLTNSYFSLDSSWTITAVKR